MPYVAPAPPLGFLPSLPSAPKSGRFYVFPPVGAVGTQVISLGTMDLMPVQVLATPSPALGTLNFEVTTANAGATWRAGLYALDDGLEPIGAPVWDLGTKGATAVGALSWTITSAQSDALTPGNYAVALFGTGTGGATARSMTNATALVPYLAAPAGNVYGAMQVTGLSTVTTTPLPTSPTITGNLVSPRFSFTT